MQVTQYDFNMSFFVSSYTWCNGVLLVSDVWVGNTVHSKYAIDASMHLLCKDFKVSYIALLSCLSLN